MAALHPASLLECYSSDILKYNGAFKSILPYMYILLQTYWYIQCTHGVFESHMHILIQTYIMHAGVFEPTLPTCIYLTFICELLIHAELI